MKKVEIREKGKAVEKEVASILGITFNSESHDYFDLDFEGTKIEVKSAELFVRNYGDARTGKLRVGKFTIIPKNHKKLLTCKGYYAFVLTFKRNPVIVSFVPARKISPSCSKVSLSLIYQGVSCSAFKNQVLGGYE